jgi:hypothetical protein
MSSVMSPPPGNDFRAKARLLKNELVERLFGVAIQSVGPAGTVGMLAAIPKGHNVLGVGLGARETGDAKATAAPAIRVYVRTKYARSALSRADTIPSSVNGTYTDVIAVGDVTAFTRPTACGVSVGHYQITAGTLGCLVTHVNPGTDHYILSNCHVLANSNLASIGDPILEPGLTDGGSIPIATLSDFEPIDFNGPNVMDAAIANVTNTVEVQPEILEIGSVQSPSLPPTLYQSVRKHGRTTLHTIGVVVDSAADIRVRYGTQYADFEDQISISGAGGVFSDGGDSGSLVVDGVTCRPVGLLFAGGRSLTFANPIDPVLQRFRIAIA